MKNLKKVLALGLALVMILGMFTIASAAETKKTAQDFTDWADVEHKDAVALAVDLGIISGKPDGSFAPNDPIDRASWAKLVYYTATGDDNADAYLGTATDLTDVTGNWAESYINYIYVNEYVSGDGQGHFMPTSNITVAGGLKTMLTVLGYDAEDRGYQNDSAWMGNIMTDAKRNGLMDDVDRKNTAATNLTRDVAAQIVYNALQAQIVTPEYGRDNGESYVVRYNKVDGLTLGYDVFDIVKVTATIGSVNGDGEATFSSVDSNSAHAVTAAALNAKKVKAPSTLLGEKATLFVTLKGDKTLDKVVSSSVVKAASSAAKTFTGGVVLEEIVTSGKDDFVGAINGADHDAVKVLMDGADKTTTGNASTFDSTAITAAGKAGNIVDVYTTDGKVSMIKITTYSVEQVTDAIETRTSNKVLQVKVPGVFTGWKEADKIDGYQGLAKDDVVLVNIDTNGQYTIEKAEKVTGKVTLRSGDKLTIGGTQYEASGIANNITDTDYVDPNGSYTPDGGTVTTNWAGWNVKSNKDNEYDFYMDKNGTVCTYKQVSGETKTEVAYVIDCTWVSAGGLASSKYMEAKLLFTDATTEIVRVDKVDSKKVVASDTVSPKSDEITYSAEDTSSGSTVQVGASKVKAGFVDFSVNKDGNYELTAKTARTDLRANGQVDQKPAFYSGLTGDSKTVFLVKKGDDYSTYTSFKNVPKMTASAIVAVEKDDIATYVYLETSKFEGEGSDGLIYIRNADVDQDTSGNNVYNIVDANGEEKKMALTIASGTIDAKTFYIIDSIDNDGVATVKLTSGETNIVTATSSDTTTNAMKAGSGIVTVSGTSYEVDDTTVAVIIDLSKDSTPKYVSAGKLSLNNYKEDLAGYNYAVTLIKDGTHADYVYVVRTEK